MSSKKGRGIWALFGGIAIGVAATVGIKYLVDKEEKQKTKAKETIKQDNKSKNNSVKTKDYSDIDDMEAILDPITQEVMVDPVVTPDGITYDRTSILKWLDKNNTCPITKKKLTKDMLSPNYALKNMINEYHEMKTKDKK